MENTENMNTVEKLNLAQRLLSDVYFDYQEKNAINSLMSCADDCIWECINLIKKGG